MRSISGRPKEIDSIVLLALDDRFCIHRTRLHQLSFGEEIVVLEGFVDAWETARSERNVGVVSTCRIRWGRSSSQVSVRGTLSPTQSVSRFFAY